MNFKTCSIDKFCFGPAVEIKPEEKALIEDEKEIIELVKKEREKEIDLIRVKEYVKPIVFPYKKVVKVYEKPIGKPILSISRLSFFSPSKFPKFCRDRIGRSNGNRYRGFERPSRPLASPRVKFLRYRGNHDQVPIIKPAVREARLDRAPRFENHEESYRVSNESCQTSSRLVRFEHCEFEIESSIPSFSHFTLIYYVFKEN